MFKIKRKLIIAICLSLALISGCGQDGNKPVHIFSAESSSDASQASVSSNSSSANIGSSAQSSSVTSPPQSSSLQSSSPESTAEQSSEEVSIPETSSVSSESEPQIIPETPVIETQTVIYCSDPENSCSITFDGESITVKGVYSDVFRGVDDIYPKMNIKSSLDGGIMTCVLTPKNTRYDRDIGSFAILDKNKNQNVVHIDLSGGSITFPDISEIVQTNGMAVSSVVNASDARVAQYITLDGSRDRIPEILGKIQSISDEICEGIDSDYDKLRAISRWVSDNIYYDHPIYNKGAPQYCLSLEYMLNGGSSICGGYSNMTSALCAAQGIRCYNISGAAVTNRMCFLQDKVGAFHEWNVAEIDGRLIIVDSGWNSANSLNNNGTLRTGLPYYKYFDIGEDVFALNHKAQSAEYRDYWALIR